MILNRFIGLSAVAAVALMPVVMAPAMAQDAEVRVVAQVAGQAAAPAANATGIALELNKLETTEKGCRAVVVVNNQSDTAYQTLKLELVMFEGGVFTRRIAVDLAPVRPQKRSVKLFEIDNIACDKITELLINDVMDCKTDAGAVDSCLQRLSVSSLASAKLSK